MYSLILILLGIFTLYNAIKFLKDPQFAKSYIKKNPKAFIWKKLFGEEKAIKITKHIFAPIGIILGGSFILIGLSMLLQ